MIDPTETCEAFLKAQMPLGWKSVRGPTLELAQRLRPLPWPERLRVLDAFFWEKAQMLLTTTQITAVINRQVHVTKPTSAVSAYATAYSTLTAAVLLLLAEPAEPGGIDHALVLLVSRDVDHQDAARHWLSAHVGLDIVDPLSRLPGLAFLLLTCSTNDTFESFVARDAFWTAMLGHR